MKQTTEVVTKRRRRGSFSEEEIFSAIKQFEQAGNITIKEFTEAFQISEATFYNWRKRYRSKDGTPSIEESFVEVDLSPVEAAGAPGEIFAEFKGIVFYQRVEAAYLKALL